MVFSATDLARGNEVWSSDGTPAGTERVADIRLGPQSSFPRFLTPVSDRVFLFARAGATEDLWVADPRRNTARRVTRRLGDGSWQPLDTAAVGDLFLFADAGSTATGFQPRLWVSDGTPRGTAPVADLSTNYISGFGFYAGLATLGSRVLFSADGPLAVGGQLWSTDGTSGNTEELVDFSVGSMGSAPDSLTFLGQGLFFSADTGIHGREPWLWRSGDSSPIALGDLNPGSAGSAADGFVDAGGDVFFVAEDADHGRELRCIPAPRSVPAASGIPPRSTILTFDVRPGPESSWPDQLASLGDRLAFVADDGQTGRELWIADGCEDGGVRQVADFEPGPHNGVVGLTTLGSDWVFVGRSGGSSAIFRTDGTATGTSLLVDVPSSWLRRFQERVVFTTADGLTVSDGTPEGTFVLGDSGNTRDFASTATFFCGSDFNSGVTCSDGSAASTFSVSPPFPFRFPFDFQIAAAGGRIYFTVPEGQFDTELWVTDGTPTGTRRIRDIFEGPGSSDPLSLTDIDGLLVFSAFEPSTGREMWVTDGERAVQVVDLSPGPRGSAPSEFTQVGDRIVFAASGATHLEPFDSELWQIPIDALREALTTAGAGAQSESLERSRQ